MDKLFSPKKGEADTKVNKVIQYLTISDTVILSAWSLLAPFIPIFITERISDGSIEVVGFATTIALATRSLVQIPFARLMDKQKGEKDDYWYLFVGSVLVAGSAVLFKFATLSWHVYLIQVINGASLAITYPSWYAIFTRHLDPGKKAFEWSYYDVVVALGSALAAALGGFVIQEMGFDLIFYIVAGVNLIGIVFIWLVRKDMYSRG